jgi:diguanylate cyclase (GGDEF)-like protein
MWEAPGRHDSEQRPITSTDATRSPVERLLRRWRPYRTRRLTPRELRVESFSAACFVVVAAAMPVVLPSERDFDPLLALALVAGHVIASRVPLHVGAGSAVPTQVVLVPMLLLLPPAVVPALVACSSIIAAALDMALDGARPERLVTGIGDAWHAVGSGAFLALTGEPGPEVAASLLLVGALASQFAADLAAAIAREWAGRGINPGLQFRVVASVQLMDVCLTPVGLLAAAVSAEERFNFALVLPLLVLLAALASDRRTRLEEIGTRLDELRKERSRLDGAIRRIGDALASPLERSPLAEVALRTAVEALDAARGSAVLASGDIDFGDADEDLAAVMDDTVDDARRHSGVSASASAGGHAIAYPLGVSGEHAPADVLVVARREPPFSPEERGLFRHLAGQVRVAMENVALHHRLRRQATEDELTGLANHRRFQEVLTREVERSRRSQRPVALVLLDIDNFKGVNDQHGHQQGDAVLREVAQAIQRSSRATDEPARYGGEELAVVLPDTDLEGARVAAEKMRRAVEALEVPLTGDLPLRVTVSAGVSVIEVDGAGAGPGSLVAAADAALYEAKRGGKNRSVCGEPARHPLAAAALEAAGRRFIR